MKTIVYLVFACINIILIFYFIFNKIINLPSHPKKQLSNSAYNTQAQAMGGVEIQAFNKTEMFRVILVTYAQNEPFTSSQQKIAETQSIRQDKSIDFIEQWNLGRVLQEFPQYKMHWTHEGRNGRPSCCFFKPVLMFDVMSRFKWGDWIIWIDSSRYFGDGVKSNLRKFIGVLHDLNLDVFPGVALCGISNVDNRCVSIETFQGMNVDTPKYWFAPHFQNNMFAFQKTPNNLNFMKEWKEMMSDLNFACASGSDDQAIFSILVTKFNLKFLNLCDFSTKLNEPHFQNLKNVDYVIEMVSTFNTSHVMKSQENFIMKWRTIGWSPFNCKLSQNNGYYEHAEVW